MQFHLNGFSTGDPSVSVKDSNARAASDDPKNTALPEFADVLIIGCGPAGLTLAAQLSVFPDIRTVIVEQKPGPLQLGQADGIACRTMEMFEAFGFVDKVLKESYWVNETTFWKPDESIEGKKNHIVRSGRVPDVEDGLSHMPHVILNQARVHDFYLEIMKNSSHQIVPRYSRRMQGLDRDVEKEDDCLDILNTTENRQHFPVTVRFERQDAGHEGEIEIIRARYVVGCDGARSGVRQAMGLTLKGDSANHAWGVMDVLVVTDFPDIRFKSLIQSANEGSILIIPREGGYMVRLYVELDKLNPHERVSNRNITLEQLIAAAQRIIHPYKLDIKEVPWWSVYEIGQRLCDRFDDLPNLTNLGNADTSQHTSVSQQKTLPRVFIAGDACHTHSPKAGQGMNVSMQDAFNLGWKLAAVLQKRSLPSLLRTYSEERQAVAQNLIDFDREWAAMLSTSSSAAEVQRYFVQHGRYTAGTATVYKPALLTGGSEHQQLAIGLQIGTRFHSAPVIRIGDGKVMQLGETLAADGRWRLIAFAGQSDDASSSSPIRALCNYLTQSPDSPVKRFSKQGTDIDTVFDVRAVFQKSHADLPMTAMPDLLFPSKGRYGLRDYEKAFCAIATQTQDIYAMRGIDRQNGCLVIVRPDQYIASVLPLAGYEELNRFFHGFMLAQN